MNKKLDVDIVFCDLDDTLVGVGKQETTLYNEKAIAAYKQTNKKFVIATGRSLERSMTIAKKLQVDYGIFSNGGLVYSFINNQIIHTSFIDKNHLQSLLNAFFVNSAVFFTFYCVNSQKQKTVSFYWGKPNNQFLEHRIDLSYFQVLTDFKELENWKTFRVNIFGLSSDLKPFYQHLQTTTKFLYLFNYSTVLEINAQNTSKGSGVFFLLKKLNIKSEKAVAFGDGSNDIAMLKLVKWGIAVANAKSTVKAIAHLQTDSCDQSGVGKALFKLII